LNIIYIGKNVYYKLVLLGCKNIPIIFLSTRSEFVGACFREMVIYVWDAICGKNEMMPSIISWYHLEDGK
jgi:hypothetical protein